ncbi:MAG: translation initiation factor, partial [Opitutales bacterium]
MTMSQAGKISTDGGDSLAQNPFGALSAAGLPSFSNNSAAALPSGAAKSTGAAHPAAEPKGNRGRVEIRRTTAGRGGKTVTLVTGFMGIGGPEKETLAKRMRAACG